MFCVSILLIVSLPQLQTLAVGSEKKTRLNDHFSSTSVVSCERSCGNTNSSTAANGASDCSFGYYCTSGNCRCRKAPSGIVKCSKDGLHNFAVLDCYCATFDRKNCIMELGECAWGCDSASHSLNISDTNAQYRPWNYNMCEALKRMGTLCGKCLPDHYLLAYCYSFACARCYRDTRWSWVRYIMVAYLPLTLFCLVVLFFKINVVSSHLHPVVFFSQLMSASQFARIALLSVANRPSTLVMAVKTILSFYGVWNLDFFRPFYSDLCLGIGILPTLALDYAIAVYPLLLTIISYLLIVLYDRNYRAITIMWRPFRVLFSLFRRNWDIRTSAIDAFSTFFLLSNVKFLSVSFDLLVPTRVYHLYGDTYNYTLGLYYSGDIEYFGREHLPYAILAIIVLCTFVILPNAILALYPFAFFQKFLNLFTVRWYILHTFVDSFQGCYKDGTEPGTRDYRWFAAVYLLLRFVLVMVYGVTLNKSYFSLSSIVILLTISVLVAFQPYKNRVSFHYKSNILFLVLCVITYSVSTSIGHTSVAASQGYHNFLSFMVAFFALVPLVYILGFTLYWVFSRCRCCLGLVHRLRWWRRGYVAVGDDGHDAAADACCDRMANPQAYPAVPAGRLVNYSSLRLNS